MFRISAVCHVLSHNIPCELGDVGIEHGPQGIRLGNIAVHQPCLHDIGRGCSLPFLALQRNLKAGKLRECVFSLALTLARNRFLVLVHVAHMNGKDHHLRSCLEFEDVPPPQVFHVTPEHATHHLVLVRCVSEVAWIFANPVRNSRLNALNRVNSNHVILALWNAAQVFHPSKVKVVVSPRFILGQASSNINTGKGGVHGVVRCNTLFVVVDQYSFKWASSR